MLQEHVYLYVTAPYVAISPNNHLILVLLLGFDEKYAGGDSCRTAASLSYPEPFSAYLTVS